MYHGYLQEKAGLANSGNPIYSELIKQILNEIKIVQIENKISFGPID